MKRHLKIKLSEDLKIIEANIHCPNTGKFIRAAKLSKGLKEMIESKYIEFEIHTNT